LAASIAGVQVDAFEPASLARARLRANVERNQLADRVTVHDTAVGSVAGESVITTDRGTMNRLDLSSTGERVRVVRLDDVLTRPPAIIKIDVEGFELDVLRGAEATIASHRPALLVEANDPAGLKAWSATYRYRAFRYDVAAARLEPAEIGDAANAILLSEDR
jgi:FkbM family methyltransferase